MVAYKVARSITKGREEGGKGTGMSWVNIVTCIVRGEARLLVRNVEHRSTTEP